MKILVTGAGGQVGRAIMSTAPRKYDVFGRTHSELDIANEREVLRKAREYEPDVIINAAAYTAVDRAESEVDAARRINVNGARSLAAAAREIGARLLHISTDFVFDGSSSSPYQPYAATNPLSVYGITKRDGENVVRKTLPETSIILRTAWVYAPQGGNFLLTMLRLMNERKSIRVISDQVGTPTSARSLAETIWEIVARPSLSGIHHWTDAGVATWYDFAVAIAEEASALRLVPSNVAVIPITTHEYPTPARRPPYSVLDKSSLTSLGIELLHWRKRLLGVLGEIKNA